MSDKEIKFPWNCDFSQFDQNDYRFKSWVARIEREYGELSGKFMLADRRINSYKISNYTPSQTHPQVQS